MSDYKPEFQKVFEEEKEKPKKEEKPKKVKTVAYDFSADFKDLINGAFDTYGITDKAQLNDKRKANLVRAKLVSEIVQYFNKLGGN